MSKEKSLDELFLDKLLAERMELDKVIDAVKKRLGKIDSSPKNGSNIHQDQIHILEIHHDTFYGMSIVDASKKYLSIVGKPARATREIMEGLKKGGLDRPYSTVSSVLARAVRNDEGLKNVGRGHWGLSEWYSNTGRKE